MSKTIQEQIEIMKHYANSGEVEYYDRVKEIWLKKDIGEFDWKNVDYRIKKTITIEKWLCEYDRCGKLEGSKRFFILEKVVPFEFGNGKKVKLLDTYEVEL